MLSIEVHIKGEINPDLADWFEGVSIQANSAEETCLCWVAVDRSAIYGVLSTLGSLGLSLISVTVTEET